MAKGFQNLVIVNHVVHYCSEDRLFAYGPYAREIDVWADLFPRVVISAPLRHEPPPAECLAFTRSNISVLPVKETGGQSLKAKLVQVVCLPPLIASLCKVMHKADAIHVRCPGNLGLLGALLAPLFSRCLVAKYAGQWDGYPGEPRTVRLQRALLRSRWWRGPVTVYGEWPGQPAKIIPFFTSILSDEQIGRARQAVRNKRSEGPLRVLYVGRLSKSKNVDTLLEAAALLKNRGVGISCAVLGDGPERRSLEARSSALDLDGHVQFTGAVPFERVLEFYEWADVLVLTSETEGWPKAIAEAMAFGLICIGSNRGFVPQMLGENRGLVVTPRDVPALVSALEEIATQGDRFSLMRAKAAEWAQCYSLEGLREALRELLSRNWGVTIERSVQAVGGPV
jgi:glycosyltransferase involved in cell wall biosynthesis